jgi:hypothetical protein
MPCIHKFQEYLELNKGYLNPELNKLDFEPITLIVGTFNPSWPAENNASWFYGRTNNNYFWDVLPRLYNHIFNLREEGHNNPMEWREFCFNNQIAITDLISSINDADQNNEEHQNLINRYLDNDIANHFEDFTFTQIINILDHFPKIKNVYLTRQQGIELFDQRWAIIEQYSAENPERNLHLRKLITPSASARFQIRPYRQAHPEDMTPLRNFIYNSWLEQWHL